MKRQILLISFVVLATLAFIARLSYLQLTDNSYQLSPFSNSSTKVVQQIPERGYIYDRNNKLLVANQPSYDIRVIPREVKEIDTLELCTLLKIDKELFIKNLERAKKYSLRKSSVFLPQVSKEDYAALQEKMHKFNGFFIQKNMLREYPINSAANVLGYLSEVNKEIMDVKPYYQLGDNIGFAGIEKYYEKELRGRKGVKYFKTNKHNKIIGSFKGGVYDTLAIPGKDLAITLDIELQKYGEALMQGKRGGIIAIEPKTGEILTMISTPTYNPNLMIGRERSKNSPKLFGDQENKPMFDRGLQATYAPGSPFKIVNGLIGLQEGVITTETGFKCYHGYRYGGRPNEFMKCHCGIVGYPIRLEKGIAKSCNSYFSNTYRRIIENYPTAQEGMNAWSEHVKSFGLGKYLGNDLTVGQKGLIPDASYYNRYYPLKNWKAVTTISNAIGQGEILVTPIQLANLTAIVANRGFYYTPHILKKINNEDIENPNFVEKKYTTVDAVHFDPVVEGMLETFENGTARASKIEGIEICGKTGTVENFIRVEGKKVKLEDHSILVAFAPKDNPKIAIAVYVENGGFGSNIAAPITSLMIEKYLTGEVKRTWIEDRMYNTSLEEEYNKRKKLLEVENEEQ
ncbi:penicillin-binding protein 2 [Aureivirga sp. CE67]|uniref:penicillin-binding protein 2 n=1 Tax=Aureivirga sp. CE67 TaxID=1788983 RepID=UPI0018CA424C|nr:penicillin-binding protein 2 [Aureivirga sp. CE67]